MSHPFLTYIHRAEESLLQRPIPHDIQPADVIYSLAVSAIQNYAKETGEGLNPDGSISPSLKIIIGTMLAILVAPDEDWTPDPQLRFSKPQMKEALVQAYGIEFLDAIAADCVYAARKPHLN